jgi:periplasmic protein CpxP/Spy
MENKTLAYWKVLAFLLLALNIVLVCFLLFRHPAGMKPFMRFGGNPGKYLSEKLKFSEQQEAEFDKLREAHHDSMMILNKEGMQLRKKFFDGLIFNSPENNKEFLAGQIAHNQKQIEQLTYRHFEKIKNLCKPGQKIIYNNIILEVINKLKDQPKERPGEDRR